MRGRMLVWNNWGYSMKIVPVSSNYRKRADIEAGIANSDYHLFGLYREEEMYCFQ